MKRKPARRLAAFAALLRPAWAPVLMLVWLPLSTSAAPQPAAERLVAEIRNHKNPSFEKLLRRWQSAYGTAAVGPLLTIASGRSTRGLSDTERYVALMGAAKLGGKNSALWLEPLLKDRSWMIRSGTLRALAALGHPATASATLPLLKDPALLVRATAVEAVERLNPPGAAQALADEARMPENFHGGRAEWASLDALDALARLAEKHALLRASASGASQMLTPLLAHRGDRELLARVKKARAALQKL